MNTTQTSGKIKIGDFIEVPPYGIQSEVIQVREVKGLLELTVIEKGIEKEVSGSFIKEVCTDLIIFINNQNNDFTALKNILGDISSRYFFDDAFTVSVSINSGRIGMLEEKLSIFDSCTIINLS